LFKAFIPHLSVLFLLLVFLLYLHLVTAVQVLHHLFLAAHVFYFLAILVPLLVLLLLHEWVN